MTGIYSRAANRYRPANVETLFVAEAPPPVDEGDAPRYFYFESVPAADHLYRELMVALGIERSRLSRNDKAPLLSGFRDAGYFLIDVSPTPLDKGIPKSVRKRELTACVPDLMRRVRRLSPERVVVIKDNVCDLVVPVLREAGLWVPQPEAIPFPAQGWQPDFRKLLRLLDLRKLS